MKKWDINNPCPTCGNTDAKKLICKCCNRVGCEICVKAKKDIIDRIFIKTLRNMIDNTYKNYLSISSISHSLLKGKAREIFIKNILEPILPNNFNIVSGTIVDYLGNDMGESDLIIYDSRICKPIKISEDFQIVPLESVLHIIEVKSKLTSNEIIDSIKKFKRLMTELELAPISIENKPFTRSLPYCSIFSYETSTTSDEIDRIMNSKEKGGEHFMSFLSIFNKGTWVRQRVDSEKRYNWLYYEYDQDSYLHIRAYITFIIKSLYKQSNNLLFAVDSEGHIINQNNYSYLYEEIPKLYYCPDLLHHKIIKKNSTKYDEIYNFLPFG